MAYIEARSVYAGYGASQLRVEVLQGVCFEIQQGETIAISGPSGSGKTTLLSLLGGLEYTSSGSLCVDGLDLSRMGRKELGRYRRERVGFVFQFFNLLPTLTALENVELGLAPLAVGRAARRRRAEAALARVGLAESGRRLPHELSGGEQQRVAVARAWAKDPPILLADEPTGNLDEAAGKGVLDLLVAREQEGARRTVIVATHDPAVAARASRVLSIHAHRVEEA